MWNLSGVSGQGAGIRAKDSLIKKAITKPIMAGFIYGMNGSDCFFRRRRRRHRGRPREEREHIVPDYLSRRHVWRTTAINLALNVARNYRGRARAIPEFIANTFLGW